MQTKPRVWITNRGFHNYDSATKYGRLTAITVGGLDLRHLERLEADVQRVLSRALDSDYILLSGAPIVQVLCIGYMYRRFGHVNVIDYDNGTKQYVTRPQLDFAQRDIPVAAGTVSCPQCGRILQELDTDIQAIANEPCVICIAEQEEELINALS